MTVLRKKKLKISFFIPVKPNNPAALSNSQAIITAMEDTMKNIQN